MSEPKSMSFTDGELESIADGLRLLNYNIDDVSNDDLALIAEAVLEALGIEYE
jgi:hypothetical protein